MRRFTKIGCVADKTDKAQAAFNDLCSKYDFIQAEKIDKKTDVIVVLGGDGFMLHSMHSYLDLGIPFYGMNSGTVGFLMNELSRHNLLDRINNAQTNIIHPLEMKTTDIHDKYTTALAINEVSLLRQSNQAAKIRIEINGSTQIAELISDGILVSTAAGSSAYNFSAGGPIIPIESNILSMTAISPFRPKRWSGALLPHTSSIIFEVLDSGKRPVSAVADFYEVRDVCKVEIRENRECKIKLLFDPGHSLEERIIREQFN